jgi:hypothetical protein
MNQNSNKVAFDIILKGSKEFYPNLNNKKYLILKVDDEPKQNFMSDIFEKFIQNQNKNINQNHWIGIDFEFNKVRKAERDVALMQINLENDSDTAYIFVLYPPELNKRSHDLLLKLITHKQIYKILHGAESLDIPYLFDQLLIETNLIDGLCTNFYDTRFLCDYYHIEKNIQGRCSIYYLLLEQKIITQEKFDELEKIEEKTGPIYLVTIDIHKLGFHVLRYSLYDVIYLPELIRKFIQMGWTYSHLVPEVTCMINKYKRYPDNKLVQLEKLINSMNLYFIYESEKIILMNEIWEIYNVTIEEKYLIKIQQIPYFKKIIEIVMKFVIYQNICSNLKVYMNKKELIKDINWDEYWEEINKYPHFKKSISFYNHLIKIDISNRITK